MILVSDRADETGVRILARGNFSLDARGLLVLLLALGMVTLSLAAVIALKGYWPVLPFALAQLALVAFVLIRAWQNAWVREWIEIDRRRTVIVHQRYKTRRRTELGTAWVRVRLEEPESSWYAPRLVLRGRGQSVEVGSFLTGDEKRDLARLLARELAGHAVL